MEKLRYLLAAMAALTLIMSVVSGVNPSYFAGLNAFADHDEEEDDDSLNSANSEHEEKDDEHEDGDDQDDDGSNENNNGEEEKLVESLGNHSNVTLKIDEDVELQVEIENGDLRNGTYDVVFSCNSPGVDKEFADSLNVTNGQGEFEEELSLTNGTYSGCIVEVGDLSATFIPFDVKSNDENEEDDENEDDSGRDGKDDDNGSLGRSNDDDNEQDGNNSGRGSHNEDGSDDQRHKERAHRIVTSTSGTEIHERHRNANAASPGDYRPGWNYTLNADGEAMHGVRDENLVHEANATINMSVWKSNSAIILLDVVGGTIEVDDQDYNVRVGYAIYSTQHDAMMVAALATDDDGNVFSLKLRGSAVDESARFPMESGSIDIAFGGDVNNRFEDWNLLLEGTVEAS